MPICSHLTHSITAANPRRLGQVALSKLVRAPTLQINSVSAVLLRFHAVVPPACFNGHHGIESTHELYAIPLLELVVTPALPPVYQDCAVVVAAANDVEPQLFVEHHGVVSLVRVILTPTSHLLRHCQHTGMVFTC